MCMNNYTYVNYDLLNKSRKFILEYLPNFTSNRWYNYKYNNTQKILLLIAKTNICSFVIIYKFLEYIKPAVKRLIKKNEKLAFIFLFSPKENYKPMSTSYKD